MRILRTISAAIQKVCNVIAASILGIITIVFFVNIIQRYAVGQGFHGNEEITRYGTIWMVFICGVILTRLDEHLNVSILEGMLKGASHKAVKFMQRAVMLVFYGIMFNISIGFVQIGARQTSPNLEVPMNYVYLIFPVCFGLMAFQVLCVILDDLLAYPEPSSDGSAGEGGKG